MSIRTRAPEELDDKSREILERRAERLRMPPQVAQSHNEHHLAQFPVGEDLYAIPLAQVRAVVPLRRVTAVPLARPHVVGILRFQGQIITALSMAALLGIKGWSHDPSVLLVVDPGWGRLVAIDCEQVPRAIGLVAGALDEARARSTGPLVEVANEGRMLHVIELSKLLDRRTGGRGGG